MKKFKISKHLVSVLSILTVAGSLTACGTVGNTPNTTNPTTNPTTTNPITQPTTTNTDTSYNRGTTSSRNFNSTTTAENYNSINNYPGTYNTTNDRFTNSSFIKGTLSKYATMTDNVPTYNPGADVAIDFMFNNNNATVNNASANPSTIGTTGSLNDTTAGKYKNLKVYVYKDSAIDSNLVDTHNVKDFKGGKIATGKDLSHNYTFKAPSTSGSYVYKAVVKRDGVDEVYYDHFKVK